MTRIQGPDAFETARAVKTAKGHMASIISRDGEQGREMILDRTISHVHRDRDFGRVEASVTFLVKTPGRPARPVTIRTNVLAHGVRPLRERLIEDADRLAQSIVTSPVPLPRVA